MSNSSITPVNSCFAMLYGTEDAQRTGPAMKYPDAAQQPAGRSTGNPGVYPPRFPAYMHLCRWHTPAWYVHVSGSSGAMHNFIGAMHNFSGAMHNFVGALHSFVGALHNFPGAMHNFVGAMHNFVGALHNFVGALHNFPGALHNFFGALHKLKYRTGVHTRLKKTISHHT
jgi:hypothetical protein